MDERKLGPESLPGDAALLAGLDSDDAARARARKLGGCGDLTAPELDMLLGRGPRSPAHALARRDAEFRSLGIPVPDHADEIFNDDEPYQQADE